MNIKILMKKFTVSILTALVFAVVSMFGAVHVSAQENEMTASISVEEFIELDNAKLTPFDISLQSDSTGFSFYDQLDANNKAAYDVLQASWLEPTTEPVIYNLSEKVKYQVSSSDFSSWTQEQLNEFWNLVFNTFMVGETVFEFDNPEIFWFEKNEIEVSIGTSTSYSFRTGLYTITVNKVQLSAPIRSEFGDVQTAAAKQEFLKNQIAQIDVEGDDHYTKIKFIHDYIANNVVYNVNSPYADTSYGMFVEPYEYICEGYAETFMLLCKKEGIKTVPVVGNVDVSTNMAHMWNYVLMEDGNWYAVDCTWDDLDLVSQPIKYQYFLKGSDSFLTNHIVDSTYITPGIIYPELSKTDYIYSVTEPAVTTTVEPVQTTVATTSVKPVTSASKSETTTSVAVSVTVPVKTTTITTVAATTTTTKITVITQSTTVTEPIVTLLTGDFNRNEVLDIGDIVVLQKKLVKVLKINEADFNYDLNSDNKLNVLDFVILLGKLTK